MSQINASKLDKQQRGDESLAIIRRRTADVDWSQNLKEQQADRTRDLVIAILDNRMAKTTLADYKSSSGTLAYKSL